MNDQCFTTNLSVMQLNAVVLFVWHSQLNASC